MERDGWLMAVVGIIAMAAPVFILVAIFVLGVALDTGSGLPTSRPKVEVLLDPVRVGLGVGAAVVLVGAAIGIVIRTDWSRPGE